MKKIIGGFMLHGIPTMLCFLGLRGGSYDMGGLVISDMVALGVGIGVSVALRLYYELALWLMKNNPTKMERVEYHRPGF